MGQRVHAGGSRDFRRQTARHLRIKHRIFRHKRQIHDRIFVVGLIVGDNGGNRCLRAGTRRGRNRNKGRQFLQNAQQTGHLADRLVRTHDACGSSLGRVHRGTAADGDEAVASVFQIHGANLFHRADAGVGFHLCKHDPGEAGSIQSCGHDGGQLFTDARAGDNDWLRDAFFFQDIRNFPSTADSGNLNRPAPMQKVSANVENPLINPIVSEHQFVHDEILPFYKTIAGFHYSNSIKKVNI